MTASVSRPPTTAARAVELAGAQLAVAQMALRDPLDVPVASHHSHATRRQVVPMLEAMASTPTSEGRRTAPGRAAQGAARRPGRLPVPRRARQGHLRRQGQVDPQARRRPLLQGGRGRRPRAPSRWSTRSTRVEFLLVASETEALLAEQNFIKQYRPRFNIRLRDDKSYPFIAISMDEDFPRVYFTRERHRRDRVYFGPYSNAKRVRAHARAAGQGLPLPLLPGRRSRAGARGSPCLDYYIKRCGAPCVGYVDARGVPRVDRRRRRLPLAAATARSSATSSGA